jgi:conjugal transfer pilus assembly protein TraB
VKEITAKFQAWFSGLSPNHRRTFMLGGAVGTIIVLSTLIFTIGQSVTADETKPAQKKSREVEFRPLTGKGTDKLENDVMSERVRMLEKELDQIKKGEILPGQSKAQAGKNPLMPSVANTTGPSAPGTGSGSVPGDGSAVTLNQIVGADPNDPNLLPGQLFAPGIVPPPVRTKRAQVDNSTEVVSPKSTQLSDSGDFSGFPSPVKKGKNGKEKSGKEPASAAVTQVEIEPGEEGSSSSAGARKLQVREISDEGDKKNSQNDGKPQAFSNVNGDIKEQGIYLPAGSIISGVLITGMDAPTANQAKRDPFPALLRVKDETILPNRFRMDVRECFLIASGYGDLSSERAYLRAETLSCVRNDGGVIEVGLNAYSVGEDGKTGVRGRLVSKNGQLIARSLMAGFLAGVADIMKPQKVATTNLVTNGNGEMPSVFSQTTAGDAFQQGALGGVNTAMNSIANYYLEMAKNMFPVIEIDAGRHVDFISIKGARLAVQSGSKGNAAARPNNRNSFGNGTNGSGNRSAFPNNSNNLFRK